MNKLYLITGPAGVGKSTVGNLLANTLSKSVLIEGDDIYNQFKSGRISPWMKDAPLNLFWDNVMMLIKNYLEAGYDVVFNYIIKLSKLNELKKAFKNYDINFVVLVTDEETLLKRDLNRPLDSQMKDRCLVLLKELRDIYDNSKYILDTTNLTIKQSVDKIINNENFNVDKMDIENIKTPEDILQYMKDHIDYGWVDIYNDTHIGNMKNFRKLYKTSSITDTINLGIGTCIEQVSLIKLLLEKINIKSKMFCTRIYEDEDFNDLESDEHMHCFILYYLDDKVYHLEHPNKNKIGIYEYESEEEAIKKINEYFINMSGGIIRCVTEYSEVPVNLTFKQFNLYINNLDNKEGL